MKHLPEHLPTYVVSMPSAGEGRLPGDERDSRDDAIVSCEETLAGDGLTRRWACRVGDLNHRFEEVGDGSIAMRVQGPFRVELFSAPAVGTTSFVVPPGVSEVDVAVAGGIRGGARLLREARQGLAVKSTGHFAAYQTIEDGWLVVGANGRASGIEDKAFREKLDRAAAPEDHVATFVGQPEQDPRYAEGEEEMYAVLVRFAYDKADTPWTGHSTLVREALRRASNMPETLVDELIETARRDWRNARDLAAQLDRMAQGTDAQEWARGLMAVIGTGAELDEGLLTSWFANAFGVAERGERDLAQPVSADLFRDRLGPEPHLD